jgi:WD40 repeat protein
MEKNKYPPGAADHPRSATWPFRAGAVVLLTLGLGSCGVGTGGIGGTGTRLSPTQGPMTVEKAGNLQEVARLGKGKIIDVRYLPDGISLAVASTTGVDIFSPDTGGKSHSIDTDSIKEAVAYSSDGKWMASGTWDDTIKIWRVSDGALVRTVEGLTDDLAQIAFSPDGKLLVAWTKDESFPVWVDLPGSKSQDNAVKIWNVSDGKLVRTLKTGYRQVSGFAFSPDGGTLVVVSVGGIYFYDPNTGQQKRMIDRPSWGSGISFSPDGIWMCTGSDGGSIRIWNVADGTLVRTFAGRLGFAFSPDWKKMASISSGTDDIIDLWNVSTGRVVRKMVGHTNGVLDVAFSADGNQLVSDSYDNTVKVWDVSSGKQIRSLEGTNAFFTFSPDGKRLVTGSQNGAVALRNLSDDSVLRMWEGYSNEITHVAFSPDGTLLAAASRNSIKLWTVPDGELVETLDGHSREVTSVLFSPDGKLLASGSDDDTLKAWNVSDGLLVRTLDGGSDGVDSIAFPPEGETLASVSGNGTLKVWNISDGGLVRIRDGVGARAVFSPDGQLLASLGDNGLIQIFNVSDNTLLQTLNGLDEWITVLVVSPDSKLVASAGMDNIIRVWNIHDGTMVNAYEERTDPLPESLTNETQIKMAFPVWRSTDSGWAEGRIGVRAVTERKALPWALAGCCSSDIFFGAFSPNGKLLAAGSEHWWKGDTINIWSISEGALVRTLKGHTNFVTGVAFSTSGELLASGSYDGTVRIWKMID